MTPQEIETARRLMRLRARRRIRGDAAGKKKVDHKGQSFGRALRDVRRSEILLFLSRQRQGEKFSYREIAERTAVPVGAVTEICNGLVKAAGRPQVREQIVADAGGPVTEAVAGGAEASP